MNVNLFCTVAFYTSSPIRMPNIDVLGSSSDQSILHVGVKSAVTRREGSGLSGEMTEIDKGWQS